MEYRNYDPPCLSLPVLCEREQSKTKTESKRKQLQEQQAQTDEDSDEDQDLLANLKDCQELQVRSECSRLATLFSFPHLA